MSRVRTTVIVGIWEVLQRVHDSHEATGGPVAALPIAIETPENLNYPLLSVCYHCVLTVARERQAFGKQRLRRAGIISFFYLIFILCLLFCSFLENTTDEVENKGKKTKHLTSMTHFTESLGGGDQ